MTSIKQLKASKRKTNGKCRKRFFQDETVNAWTEETLMVACCLLFLLKYHAINNGSKANNPNASGYAKFVCLSQLYSIKASPRPPKEGFKTLIVQESL